VTIPTITGPELRRQLGEGRPAWLIHAPGPLDLRQAHIPGAIAFDEDQLRPLIAPGDAIVVYGHDADCVHSPRLVASLLRRGHRDTRWYEGGLRDWVERGGTLEGTGTAGRALDLAGGAAQGLSTEQYLAAFEAGYVNTTGQPLPDERFRFGDDPEMGDELAKLVLAGTKRATAGLLADLGHGGGARPRVGDRAVVLDGGHRPVCVIETTRVVVVAFADVDVTSAWDEGEGDRSLEHWRAEHERFFGARCAALGIEFSPQLEVVCEHFEVVWTAPVHPPRGRP
jgi:uncharacterized protein YhfF/rhodanese-related sulfurtransferase